MAERIEWNLEYVIGVIVIDNQHRDLFTYYNELVDCLKSQNYSEVNRAIEKLEAYILQHFSYEERMMRAIQFDKLDAHAAEHRIFEHELDEIKKHYSQNPNILTELLCKFVENWLKHHILEVDMLYKEALA